LVDWAVGTRSIKEKSLIKGTDERGPKRANEDHGQTRGAFLRRAGGLTVFRTLPWRATAMGRPNQKKAQIKEK